MFHIIDKKNKFNQEISDKWGKVISVLILLIFYIFFPKKIVYKIVVIKMTSSARNAFPTR